MIEKNLTIAIPASIITNTPHLREKTAKIGLIGRTAAIFRVDKIIIFPDKPKTNQSAEIELIVTLLKYMDAPQYLRKKLFGLDAKLKFAGILPPLRTPNHPLISKSRKIKSGEYREGIIIKKVKEGMLIEIGVEKLALLRERQWLVGDRLTSQIIKTDNRIEVQTVNKEEIPFYWGFSVIPEKKSLSNLIANNNFDLIIGTAKKGADFNSNLSEIVKKYKKANNIIIEFGAPNRGLFEIAKDEGIDIRKHTDFLVNTIPKQGTETIRTEEAVIATLAIFNSFRN